MTFLRLLLFLLVALFAARAVGALLRGALVRRQGGRPPAGTGAGPPPPPRPPPPSGPAERLVMDPVCGVRLPESRAIRHGDRFYCSEACRSRDAAAS